MQRIRRLESLVEKVGGKKALFEGRGTSVDATSPSKEVESNSNGPDQNTAASSIVGNRYVAGEFWMSLGEEVDGLKQLLEQSSDDEEDVSEVSPPSSTEANQPSPMNFIFGQPGAPSSHPSHQQAALLFNMYFTNVDPLFKLLHRPTIAALLPETSEGFARIPDNGALHALFFSIYFAAVTSLSPEQCLQFFGRERDLMLARFKYSTERALANADFLNSMELMTLQAFVIYLVDSLLL